MAAEVDVSVVIPMFNEEANVEPLHAEIERSLSEARFSWEIVCIDDGSTDATLDRLRRVADADPRVTVVTFRRNYGQTAAMSAGIEAARGQILVPMDADLQNDPSDIPRLVQRLDEGYDVISGWRRNRRDRAVTRRLPSLIANAI